MRLNTWTLSKFCIHTELTCGHIHVIMYAPCHKKYPIFLLFQRQTTIVANFSGKSFYGKFPDFPGKSPEYFRNFSKKWKISNLFEIFQNFSDFSNWKFSTRNITNNG
jgi:hypothetical protein